MSVSTLTVDPFEKLTHEFIQNPYPVYKELRETRPVYWCETRRCLVLSKYKDVHFAYRDESIDTKWEAPLDKLQKHLPPRMQCPVSSILDRFRPASRIWMSSKNPPVHARMKRLVGSGLTPSRLEVTRKPIEEVCHSLLDQIIKQGSLDIVSDYATYLPFYVIASLLGLPDQELAKIKKWCDAIVPVFHLDLDVSVQERDGAQRPLEEFTSYLTSIVRERRKDPKDDLISEMFRTDAEGYRLNDRQVAAITIELIFAGFETTGVFLANSFLNLLRHPDQLALLRENPQMIESAVEELLRYEAPMQMHLRPVSQMVTINGFNLSPGDRVLMLTGSANRDSEAFEEPDRLDLGRTPKNKHLSFGTGQHKCIGAGLTRIEGQIAINALLQRMPNLRLATTEVTYKKLRLRGLESLPVLF